MPKSERLIWELAVALHRSFVPGEPLSHLKALIVIVTGLLTPSSVSVPSTLDGVSLMN